MRDLAAGSADDNEAESKSTVKNYDFKTANRFTKEQIRAINVVFKNFGHLLSNYLMGTLMVQLRFRGASPSRRYRSNEFNNSVPRPSLSRSSTHRRSPARSSWR
jgi:flagellar motor switch protein FliM